MITALLLMGAVATTGPPLTFDLMVQIVWENTQEWTDVPERGFKTLRACERRGGLLKKRLQQNNLTTITFTCIPDRRGSNGKTQNKKAPLDGAPQAPPHP